MSRNLLGNVCKGIESAQGLFLLFFERRNIMKFIEDLKFVYHLSKWEKAYKKGDEAGMTKHGAIVNSMCKA